MREKKKKLSMNTLKTTKPNRLLFMAKIVAMKKSSESTNNLSHMDLKM